MSLNDALDDGQTKTDTDITGSDKWFGYVWQLVKRNAFTSILPVEAERATRR